MKMKKMYDDAGGGSEVRFLHAMHQITPNGFFATQIGSNIARISSVVILHSGLSPMTGFANSSMV